MRNYGGAILTFTPFMVVILYSFHKLLNEFEKSDGVRQIQWAVWTCQWEKSTILQCGNPLASSMCLLSLLNEEMIEHRQLYVDYNYYTTVQYGESPHSKGCRLLRIWISPCKGIQDSMHGLWIPDSGCHSPTDFIFSVSGSWSMDSNRKWDSGSVLDLYSGFQSPGFCILLSNFFHYFGFHKQNFPGIRMPLHGVNLKNSQ